MPEFATSVFRWGTPWAPSTTTRAPCSWAMEATSFTGTMQPRTLETWVTATSLVESSMASSKSAISKCPSWSGMTTSKPHPCRLATRSHVMKLEWCSMTVVTIFSPLLQSRALATRFRPSVVFLIMATFLAEGAPMKSATIPWASSYSSLALWDSLWTPLSTLALYSL